MAISIYSSLVNLKHSLEKYLYDNFVVVYGIPLINNPLIEKTQNINRFVVIRWLANNLMREGQQEIRIYLNQRLDPSGFKLLEMRDNIIGVLRDAAGEIKQIPFYDASNIASPIERGKVGIVLKNESQIYLAEDNSEYKYIDATLMFGN